jgi:hypothetical protein
MLIGVVFNKKKTSHFNPAVVSLCPILFAKICMVLGDVYIHIVPAVSGPTDLCIHG